MRKPMVAGNWKMNGKSADNAALLEAVRGLGDECANVTVAVCPPFVYVPQARQALEGSGVAVGGQDCSDNDSGAFTGEVAAPMLADVGCEYVILGHSERRTLFGESDTRVAAKYRAAQKAGLKPILCVGETLEEREQGVTEEVVGRQLDAVIDAAGVASLEGAVIAYEPVWAIGTGRTATPEQAQTVHRFIRERVAAHDAGVAEGLVLLYGGSVKPDNAGELFGCDDIDGGLIGGASLKADAFGDICRAAERSRD